MAITSIGYDGSVNESQWAKMVPLVGSAHYGVSGSGDWKVTPHATLDRGLSIATGSGWGHGVLDTSDTTASLQGGTVSSGSRWDLVVMRRNWSGTGGASTFVLVPGGTTMVLPTRNTAPGTLDDQPIALVKFSAGQTSAQTIVDLRCWARNGGMIAKDDLALSYLKLPGAQIMINGTQWNCDLDTNGNPAWSTFHTGKIPLFGASGRLSEGDMEGDAVVTSGRQFLIQAGSTVATTDGAGNARIIWPKPFPVGILTVTLTNGDSWAAGTGVSFHVAGNAALWGVHGGGSKSEVVYSAYGWRGGALGPMPSQVHRVNWIAIGW